MTVYVDPLKNNGWKLRGRPTPNSHLFTDAVDLTELHELAAKIGMHRAWFQEHSTPHYDLSPRRREAAVAAGAVEVDRRTAVEIWRRRRGRARAFQ